MLLILLMVRLSVNLRVFVCVIAFVVLMLVRRRGRLLFVLESVDRLK